MVRLEVVLRVRQELFSPTIGSTVKDRLGSGNVRGQYLSHLSEIPSLCSTFLRNSNSECPFPPPAITV